MLAAEVIAVAVFLLTYAFIIDGRVHRSVAAMGGASAVVLAQVVPWDAVPSYLDLDTLLLLIGMMIIVGTARESGLFEYIAIRTAKAARGSPVRVLVLFALVTAVVSAFLDNVTTVLLLTPMLLYIARTMEVSAVPLLLAEIFASNIGGTATLIGDPPNIMIASAAGLGFNDFLLTMGPIALLNLLVVTGMLAWIAERRMRIGPEQRQVIRRRIEALNEQSAIRDRHLFGRSVATIVLVVALFFLHGFVGLEPAAVALIGASVILLWTRASPEAIFEKIEWPALFFFGGLFIVVGALVETGLIAALAGAIVANVDSTGEALLIIAWFSAFASALVDNIPLTATLIPLIRDMGLSMDVTPLWWALSLGACLGGNGSAIGASANVVVLGIAARERVDITFLEFLAYGVPVLAVTMAIGTAVLWLRFV
ncbi:MAG: ArsB/NhaD family transporter [Methanomicrobiales archaeon]|nr:ArsB/NhaD family transporter [Methanomicrobiales archaeon]